MQTHPHYEPEQWRSDEQIFTPETLSCANFDPTPRDQTRLLELLGKINYKILTGKKVYVEAGGVVYKTLYGGYWRSVFTGIEHYLLRCETISDVLWNDEETAASVVDLPIVYSNEGWTANGNSLTFMLSRE